MSSLHGRVGEGAAGGWQTRVLGGGEVCTQMSTYIESHDTYNMM